LAVVRLDSCNRPASALALHACRCWPPLPLLFCKCAGQLPQSADLAKDEQKAQPNIRLLPRRTCRIWRLLCSAHADSNAGTLGYIEQIGSAATNYWSQWVFDERWGSDYLLDAAIIKGCAAATFLLTCYREKGSLAVICAAPSASGFIVRVFIDVWLPVWPRWCRLFHAMPQ
jgi:hypothetical protein